MTSPTPLPTPHVTPDEGLRSSCYYCAATRRDDCGCEWDFATLEPFAWCGFRIRTPHLSVCARFFVDPTLYYGPAFVAWLATLPTPTAEDSHV